jgi:hypothetical protein
MPQSKVTPSKITKVQSPVKKTTKKLLKQKSDSELQIMLVDNVMEVPKKTKIIKTVPVPVPVKSDKSNESAESDESDESGDSDDSDDSKQKITQSSQRKRGRPKKTIAPVQKQSVPQKLEPEEEQLILHIPIYNDDGSSDKNIFTMKDESEDSLKKKEKTGSLKIMDSLTTEFDENVNDGDIKELLAEIKKKNAIIKRLKSQLTEQKYCQEINATSVCTKDTKKALINLKLINFTDNKQIVVDKTNIACWWCSYNFETIPCFIPDRYINDKFYVFGNFCTYNCAMRYNSNMGDNRMNTRTSLIKELHNRIFGPSGPIYFAPQRELLQKYGGPMLIEEFRNNELLCKKEHKINIPPLVPLLSAVEEVYRDSTQNPKNVFKKSILKH